MSKSIKQRDITDCGAACLASIASNYKLKIPISKIRQLASTDQKGTNVLGLIEAAGKLGFSTKGVRGSFESLFQVPKPAIVHVVLNKTLHHYMVIYKVTKRYVKVMDPAEGRMKKLSHDEFKDIWTGVMVLLMPNEEFKAMNETVSVAKRFWYLISPHKSVMLQAVFGAGIYTVLGLSTSIYVQKIIDNVFISRNTNLLNLMSVVMILLLLFQIFIGVYKSIFVIKTGQKIDARLILGYYKHLLSLPQRFFDTMRVGEIISRINDAVKIRAFINDVSISIVVNVFIVFFSFALMFTFYWKLALIMLMIVPLYLVVYVVTNHLNRRVERRLMENTAELESQLVESIHSVRTIKQFGAEDYANIKTEGKFINMLGSIYRSGLNNVFSSNSSEFISRLFTILLLWIGAGYVLENEITPGELLSFYALIGYLTGPLVGIIGMNKTMQNAVIAADRLFEIMDLEVEEKKEKFEIKREDIGDIAFQQVVFRYGSRAKVFDGLNLTFPKGKVTGVVGESGSGKSTLAALLQHFYSLEAGQIKIGIHDISYIEHSCLRRIVGVVPQQVDLFAGNLIDNIAFGDHQPNIQKIVGICHELGMMDFIEGLPNGFATFLGEHGASLSGGQRQRVAIARALYRDPEIIVMDEANASLDPKSEEYVQRVIRTLVKKGKTVIFITHRLSAVRDFDRILVLEKGELVEQGGHHQLFAQEGRYYQMVQKQAFVLG
ncbi:peptidase domain-containing ABC transporter [Echinicola vietnamensis]|uniref:ABC-type bacteriocin/lantibiotic exporter with N-terminal double-glycine peptidase domain n=1 Tax=Echinicola vietnamensis (strain DSM 17526 / LMG 23754 / KMM 6221) TaxID=926556 RepID=L0FYE3_ECHVK|nr:peptidase domain-containing ABC transporter [Echinicola vietnamensis]AGA78043.1 ABC-type bacteriocin/lantibiotic exporter with N-terminal double-glycine peptidase domain [Echinicola vietnamensis DSM 17526]